MTAPQVIDLKPEGLVKLREIAQESADYRDRIRAQGFEPGPDAVLGRFEISFTPEVCLSLLADRARMEKALRAADEALTQFAAFEDDARYIMGNTNFEIVQLRRTEVRQALGASQ